MTDDFEINQIRSEIDQLRSMIPLVDDEKGGGGGEGGGESPEYISGDDSNIVFTPVANSNQIKVDVYYV